jgi:glucose/arabinose dehydrogenase
MLCASATTGRSDVIRNRLFTFGLYIAATLIAVSALCAPTAISAESANTTASNQGKLDPDAKTTGIVPIKLTANSYVFDSAEQHRIRVVVIARGLKHPFAVTPLPNGDALVAERSGRLMLIHSANGVVGSGLGGNGLGGNGLGGNGQSGQAARLDPTPVSGVPLLNPFYMRGALHDVILHPDFARNRLVYFTYNLAGNPPAADAKPPIRYESRVSLMRGRLAESGLALTDVQTLYSADSAASGGTRIAFGKDGMIYLTTGSPFGDQPQRLDSAYGKVLRLRDDGTVPADNPFAGRAGARAEIYTYGHRDQLGIAVDPVSGSVLTAEMGPNGGDEINLLKAGANYGWPMTSFGRQYTGPRWSASPVAAGIEMPLVVFLPSVAPFGLAFYNHDRFPRWKGSLFVASVQRGEFPHTGGLDRIVFNDQLEELKREMLLTELHQRIGDVRVSADGLVYVVTDEDDGAVLRLEPAP